MTEPDPVSRAAGWIRALLFKDEAERARIGRGMNDDTLAVLVDAAFSLAVARRFSPDTEVREVTRQMLGIRQRYGEHSPDILEMEMVVRAELGESVPIADLDGTRVSLIKLSVFEQIVHDLGLFDDELDALLDAAARRVSPASDGRDDDGAGASTGS
jgi:hypothetical protein